MQGVEILTTTQLITEWATNWTAFWVTCAIIFAILLVIGIIKGIEDGDIFEFIGFSVTGVVFGALGGALIGGVLLSTPVDYETHYKVTISEEVSMAEFYEHYEVVDQDGKIFTIREKINEEHK